MQFPDLHEVGLFLSCKKGPCQCAVFFGNADFYCSFLDVSGRAKKSNEHARSSIKKEAVSIKPLAIKLDAENTHLSHILHLKHLFSQYRGDLPLEIHFQASLKTIAVLSLGDQGRISLSEEFKEAAFSIHCVLGIE